MRLARLNEFRRTFFTPESAPSTSALRAQIKARKLPGGLIQAGHYYIDLDEFDRATNLRQKVSAREKELASDPRLAGLI